MAQQVIQLNQEKLCCFICSDPLTDPVNIPCGHNYCKSCIEYCWCDGEIYKCLECKQLFELEPDLLKNTILAGMLEELTKEEESGLQAAPEDVVCDSPTFEKLDKNICTHHNEVMKLFCRTDQQCICFLCTIDEHKGHDIVLAKAEWTQRQKDLGPKRQEIQQRILKVENINHSADEAVEQSEKILTMLYSFVKKKSSDLKQQIRAQQESEAHRVKKLQEKVAKEISELRGKYSELKELSYMNDDTQFLLNYLRMLYLDEFTEQPSPNICPQRYFEDVSVAVSEVEDNVRDLLSKEWIKISHALSNVDVLLPQKEPEIRDDFLKYSKSITLDPNTAPARLLLSEGNRKATNMIQKQSCLSNQDRFIDKSQVMSRECLTGRRYWEVEWNGCGVCIAVTYKDISRKGEESEFGNNNESWALHCSGDGYEFNHNKMRICASEPRESSRVGVYLDHRAGVLCFYSVSTAHQMTVLHRAQTTFTQPLYAGLGAFRSFVNGSSAEFCEPKDLKDVSPLIQEASSVHARI